MTREDGRGPHEPRPIRITPGYQSFAEGSALIEVGLTRVVCSASVEERVPPFLRGLGKGWVTAEYAMLPRSTQSRTPREAVPRGRSQEIQRMIGRCLRSITNLEALGERTVLVDCDVLQADGGTRTAAITGSYVTLYAAFNTLTQARVIDQNPLRSAIAAVSVGLVGDNLLVDLSYGEDQVAQVDFNVAMTDAGELVEVQGAAEGLPFPRELLMDVVSAAERGMKPLFLAQQQAMASLQGTAPGSSPQPNGPSE